MTGTVSGRAFLSLQREAKSAGRTTAEYLRLYALEGFLLRLAHSPYRNRFILKGGVLLAAYGLRRPTTDVDGAALQTSNEAADIRQFVTAVASTALPAALDDGLTFDLDNVTAEAIRDEDKYGGVRIRLVTRLARRAPDGGTSATSSSSPAGSPSGREKCAKHSRPLQTTGMSN